MIKTTAAVALAKRPAAEATTDYEARKKIIMEGLGGLPLNRPSRPEDVADLIAFSVSARARALARTEYVIDGGTVPII